MGTVGCQLSLGRLPEEVGTHHARFACAQHQPQDNKACVGPCPGRHDSNKTERSNSEGHGDFWRKVFDEDRPDALEGDIGRVQDGDRGSLLVCSKTEVFLHAGYIGSTNFKGAMVSDVKR